MEREYDIKPKHNWLKYALVASLALLAFSVFKKYTKKSDKSKTEEKTEVFSEKIIETTDSSDFYVFEEEDLVPDAGETVIAEVKETPPSKTESNKSVSIQLDEKPRVNAVGQVNSIGKTESKKSTSQLLDERIHADAVNQAKAAGVSSKGSTSDIMDRIIRKELERL